MQIMIVYANKCLLLRHITNSLLLYYFSQPFLLSRIANTIVIDGIIR